MKKRKGLALFASDFAKFGILYAIANARNQTPTPLDPVENWQFWTGESALIEFLIKAYPSKARQNSYMQSLWEKNHADGIEAHYDVSNEFYDLFLDSKYKFYTCAEHLSDTETLEEAQENKANQLRSLMRLNGNEKILDLGCGWGAMLKFLKDSGHTGELHGFTLSKEQLAYNQQTLGFSVSLANFVTDPFKDAPYDRIFSIGSFEHVRPHELKSVYQKVYDALAPGGFAVHQFFSYEREPYPASVLFGQMFFPGSLLSTHEYHLEVAQSVGFKITHDSIHDYRPTLRAWYDRLVANQEKALQIVDVETYNRYMAFFPTSWTFFNNKESNLHRIVMEKS
ncbi:MAG: class I SAM-dependent methyltransferase [Oculatellaceae cyanobacterium Prado106]|jgi:cyclopropane-fatty-acyl-phospholipid synthase|nr:class I SAM-dependent methyltransferase [Oculatellaceae cyanobacterium Prado106]